MPVATYKDLQLSFVEDCCEPAVIQEVFQEDVYRVDRYIRGGDSFVVDLGANIGTFAILCAKRGCLVLAVEPSIRTFEALKKNVSLNSVEHRVSLVNCAIGSRNEYRDIYIHRRSANTGFNVGGEEGSIPQPVKVQTLKQLLYDRWDANIDVLKIDVEEAEREIFVAESYSVFERCHIIMLEWHNYDGHVYRDILESLGFEVELTGCGDPPPPYDPTFARGMLYARKK